MELFLRYGRMVSIETEHEKSHSNDETALRLPTRHNSVRYDPKRELRSRSEILAEMPDSESVQRLECSTSSVHERRVRGRERNVREEI